MKIDFLKQKYKVNCDRGLAKEECPGILGILNNIINWDKSTTQEEDKPVPRELKPGDCFLFDGQIVAVNDSDTLILVFSESGPLGLSRIIKEVILPENELYESYGWQDDTSVKFIDSVDKVFDNFVKLDDCKIQNLLEDYLPKGKESITAEINSCNAIYPCTLKINLKGDRNIEFSSEDFVSRDFVSEVAKELTWYLIKHEK